MIAVAARHRVIASRQGHRQSSLVFNVRWNSSIATNSCPRHRHQDGTATTKVGGIDAPAVVPELVNVPKLPFLGSIVPQYSGTTKFNFRNGYDKWYKDRLKFGHFYSAGIPSIGRGLFREIFILSDPNEFMKILRKEGPLPFGMVPMQWPFVRYYKEANELGLPGASGGSAFLSIGPEWQKFRRFLQSDLLHPSAAKGYVPGLIRASQIASKGAPLHSKTIHEYMAICSFDMFSSVAFGEFPGLASGKVEDEENKEFCESAQGSLGLIMPMSITPMELLKKALGIKSDLYRTFETRFSRAREIAHSKIKRFRQQKANGKLTNRFQETSYASLSIDRCTAAVGQENALSEDEAAEMIVMGLIAALDTTSSMLNWTMIHLALNPNVQEELYNEVSKNVAELGAKELTDACFTKSKNKYLDAVLRENHRITPPITMNLGKTNTVSDVEVHGRTIPKGSMLMLDSRSIGMDPEYVKNPDVFDPTRWFREQVENRRGTPAEVLDHPLYKEPFSAGARKCPGSRVASFEAKVLLSQLVLDWKIAVADSNDQKSKPKFWRDIEYFQGLTVQPEVPELSFERRT